MIMINAFEEKILGYYKRKLRFWIRHSFPKIDFGKQTLQN